MPYLRKEHREHLYTSGLTDQTIEKAHLFSLDDPNVIYNLFGLKESLVGPGIAFPSWVGGGKGSMGSSKNWKPFQYRPDKPRLNKDGKPVKYESPHKQPPSVYFPPPDLVPDAAWKDPKVTIGITEGSRRSTVDEQQHRVPRSRPGSRRESRAQRDRWARPEARPVADHDSDAGGVTAMMDINQAA